MLKSLIGTLLLLPVVCWALTLGHLDVQSHLNQPLQARIPLTNLENIPSDQLKVGLASQAEFIRAKMAKTNVVRSLHFKLVQSGQQHYIQVQTNERLNEPFVSFLLHVSWPQGDFIKKYIILLDPVSTTSTPAVQVTEHKTMPTIQREVPKIVNHVYGPTEKNQHLWRIANKVRPDNSVTVNQTMLALVQYNPSAFLLHNVNGLMDGYYLRIPTLKQIKENTAAYADQQIRLHNRYWKLKKKVKLLIKDRTPVIAPKPQLVSKEVSVAEHQSDTPANTQASTVSQTHAELTAPTPTQAVSLTPQTPQQSIAEDQIQALRAELDAALKDNSLLKQQQAILNEQVNKLQQQNKQLQLELKSSQESNTRLQQLMNSQAKLVVQNKQSKTSIFGWVRANWGLLLGALAILLLLILLVIRRRKAHSSDDDPEAYSLETKNIKVNVPDDLNDKDLDINIETETEREKPEVNVHSVDNSVEESAISVNEVLPEITVKEMHRSRSSAELVGDFNDILEQAKLNLDYGRSEQAKELIETAIQSEPNQVLQWDNLLRVICDLGDKKLFAKAVAKIAPELLNANEKELWQTIESLRNNFSETDFPVADSIQETNELPEDTLNESPEESSAESSAESLAEDNVEVQLSPLTAEEAQQFQSDIDEESPEDQLNLDLPTDEVPASHDTDELQLKLTDEDEELDLTIEKETTDMDDHHNVLANEDSDASKLDLIRAYIEMGDQDSARKLITELLKYGRPEIKQQAEALLSELK